MATVDLLIHQKSLNIKPPMQMAWNVEMYRRPLLWALTAVLTIVVPVLMGISTPSALADQTGDTPVMRAEESLRNVVAIIVGIFAILAQIGTVFGFKAMVEKTQERHDRAIEDATRRINDLSVEIAEIRGAHHGQNQP